MDKLPSIDHILEVGLGFAASKTLLSAVELGVFTELAKGPLRLEELAGALRLHHRSARDFLDALVALKFLDRHDGIYANTAATDYYLDRNKPSYAGGILEMANQRLYGFWGSLTEALETGKPQNEAKNGENFFGKLYSDFERLELFLGAMTGLSLVTARAIANKFPWDNSRTFADVGCAQGALPVQIALHHGHVQGIGYDLPVVRPVFERYVRSHTLEERLRFAPGDFFQDDLPRVDVLVMGHILHDWNLAEKRQLLRKAYEALPPGGALIVHEALIDDERRENALGLLMSLNMLIETPGGFDFTGADCQAWMREAGFRETRVEHLAGPDSMVVGFK
jgi:SAM-dependent methyltransferase